MRDAAGCAARSKTEGRLGRRCEGVSVNWLDTDPRRDDAREMGEAAWLPRLREELEDEGAKIGGRWGDEVCCENLRARVSKER